MVMRGGDVAAYLGVTSVSVGAVFSWRQLGPRPLAAAWHPAAFSLAATAHVVTGGRYSWVGGMAYPGRGDVLAAAARHLAERR